MTTPTSPRGPGIHDEHDLVDLAFDAMFVRGFRDRVITYWNQGAERLYGWSRQEAIGRQPAELLGSHYPIPLEQIEAQLQQTAHWEGEIVQRRKDGRRVVVACRWGLQTDRGGKPEAILEINSDLTRERQTAAQLVDSEERFSLLVSASIDYAIFMLDPTGLILTWNEGAQRIKGYAADEILGRHFSIFYPPEDIATNKPERALETAREVGRYLEEGWRVRKDGTRFWASVVITALRDQSGRLRGFGKVTRDISERKHEEERLRAHAARMEELEHTKTRFLNLASHELRGPITAIGSYLSIIQDGTLGEVPSQMVPVLPILDSKLREMKVLVNQMLETARLEDTRFALGVSRLDLRDVVHAALKTIAPVISDSHVLNVSLPHRSVPVDGDFSRLATVVANLVDNAVRYSPAGGSVDVRCVVRKKQAVIEVRDQGLGIADSDLPVLFTRFGRIVTPQNSHISGTGLGLYLSNEFVRMHAGTISVSSVPNEGSVFRITLPLATAPVDAAKDHKPGRTGHLTIVNGGRGRAPS